MKAFETHPHNNRATDVPTIKHIIESLLNKRNLPTNVQLGALLTGEELRSVNTKLHEVYRHHTEVYPIDTIADVARVLSGNFNQNQVERNP